MLRSFSWLALLLLVGLSVAACGGSDEDDPTVTPASTPTPAPGQGLGAVSGPALWGIGDKQVSRIDPETLAVSGSLARDESLWSIATTPGAVWVGGERLHRIDPATGQVTTVLDFTGDYPLDMVAAGDRLWVLVSPTWSLASDPDAPATGRLLAIDPASGATTTEIPLASNHPWQLAAGGDALWVLAVEVTAGAPTDYRVLRVDPAARTVAAILPVEFIPDDIAADADGAWVTSASNGGEAALRRIDSATGRFGTSVSVDEPVGNVILVEDTLWALGWNSSAVLAVDPAGGAPRGTLQVEGIASNIAAGLGAIWVTSYQGDDRILSRIDPTTFTITASARLADAWKVVAGT